MQSLNATYGSAFIGLIAGAIHSWIIKTMDIGYPPSPPMYDGNILVNEPSSIATQLAHFLRYLVTNFSNADALLKTTWSMNLQTDCNGLIGLIVECFFARRVWIMSNNFFITALIVILACIHFASSLSSTEPDRLRDRPGITTYAITPPVFTVEGFLLVEVTKFPRLIWVTSAGLGSAAAADIIIAGALCYYLLQSRTGFSRTDSLITTLTVYSLTTGLITSVIAFICVVTAFLQFATMPTNYIWLAFFWIMGKCYVNSALAALNSRSSLREKVGPQDGTFLQLSRYRGTASNVPESPIAAEFKQTHSKEQPLPLAVNVHTQTVSKTDYGYMEPCYMILDVETLKRTLPGTRELHLHVLVSSPRKNNSLFPFAKPRPRAYLQDILLLLSEQATPDAPRILVTAVEASVYYIPTSSCAVVYVSKIDSTGQSTAPSPTASLVRALLTFYTDPATRPLAADHLWIQLFARAQAQYLFPNSADYHGKRPLSDVKLCAWWKRVLSRVAVDVDAKTHSKAVIRPYFILPGYSELEAENSLRIATTSSESSVGSTKWVYGHPYSQTDIPLPCVREDNGQRSKNLGDYIPYFNDDPKSRFLDEMAYTTPGDTIKSPARKRSRTASDVANPKNKEAVEDISTQKDDRPSGELGKVTPDEFWERMSFRQECVAGAVTGFFSLGISTASLPKGDASASTASPLAPQPGQVSSQINKRIMTSLLTGVEFSTVERSVRATETLESAIKGLCEGIYTAPNNTTANHVSPPPGLRDSTPEPEGSASSSRPNTLLVPPSTPPRRQKHLPEVSPNPFPEPVASLETYHSHIYGSICVSNSVPTGRSDENKSLNAQKDGAESGGAPHVTVLTARKKKKRTE
ncbi:histone acetylation protein-domain-containing protein [Crucibulum laeve]|uniref:histone acetyltransferase n=1 Tax=Crucibulum laeve TaxID=68775 RepID=A0A5C3M859_9AGAR|nr:histone acetylation protein-domain-containing protein [Crucibulum laeve]